ncbi:MAG: hypothetical protein HQ513_09150 [Rhodospirillales bacterium]|nr:hypothetical protein [Rhodospirillales bacterium]
MTSIILDDEVIVHVGRYDCFLNYRKDCGRPRGKNENENFNTLKIKGYHLEHNFGGHHRPHLTSAYRG